MTTSTSTEPKIVHRAEQPYVGIRRAVTMRTIGEIADRFPELFAWLGAHELIPVGAPFFRYHVINMEERLVVEAGVPLADAVAGDDQVLAGVLPAGSYATVTHVGHPDELIDVTAALLDWAAAQGLAWDMTHADDGERWGCRLEIYQTNPAAEPDPARWETELAFRLADQA